MILISLIFVLLVLMGALMAGVVCLGQRCRRSNAAHIVRHRKAAWTLLGVTLALVLALETFVQFIADDTVRGTLFQAHLTFAATYLVVLVALVAYFTGVRVPRFHRPLGWICAGLCTGVFATGIPLLVMLLAPIF